MVKPFKHIFTINLYEYALKPSLCRLKVYLKAAFTPLGVSKLEEYKLPCQWNISVKLNGICKSHPDNNNKSKYHITKTRMQLLLYVLSHVMSAVMLCRELSDIFSYGKC